MHNFLTMPVCKNNAWLMWNYVQLPARSIGSSLSIEAAAVSTWMMGLARPWLATAESAQAQRRFAYVRSCVMTHCVHVMLLCHQPPELWGPMCADSACKSRQVGTRRATRALWMCISLDVITVNMLCCCCTIWRRVQSVVTIWFWQRPAPTCTVYSCTCTAQADMLPA